MITLAEASVLTANYRIQTKSPVKGGMFWKEAIERVINQPDVIGMRYYYARQENGTPALVLVGVDTKGNDVYRGVLAEVSWLCPPFCPEVNVLNSSREKVEWVGIKNKRREKCSSTQEVS
jgi:hypothetical protein